MQELESEKDRIIEQMKVKQQKCEQGENYAGELISFLKTMEKVKIKL